MNRRDVEKEARKLVTTLKKHLSDATGMTREDAKTYILNTISVAVHIGNRRMNNAMIESSIQAEPDHHYTGRMRRNMSHHGNTNDTKDEQCALNFTSVTPPFPSSSFTKWDTLSPADGGTSSHRGHISFRRQISSAPSALSSNRNHHSGIAVT